MQNHMQSYAHRSRHPSKSSSVARMLLKTTRICGRVSIYMYIYIYILFIFESIPKVRRIYMRILYICIHLKLSVLVCFNKTLNKVESLFGILEESIGLARFYMYIYIIYLDIAIQFLHIFYMYTYVYIVICRYIYIYIYSYASCYL